TSVMLATGRAYVGVAGRDRGACVVAAGPVVARLRRRRHDGGCDHRQGTNDGGEAQNKCSHWPAQSCPATPHANKAPFRGGAPQDFGTHPLNSTVADGQSLNCGSAWTASTLAPDSSTRCRCRRAGPVAPAFFRRPAAR